MSAQPLSMPVRAPRFYGPMSWVAALSISWVLHALLIAGLLFWGVLAAARETAPRQRHTFLIVEPAPDEEVDTADAVARAARLARDPFPEPKPEQGPHLEGELAMETPRVGPEDAPAPGPAARERPLPDQAAPRPSAPARETSPPSPAKEPAPEPEPAPESASASAPEPIADIEGPHPPVVEPADATDPTPAPEEGPAPAAPPVEQAPPAPEVDFQPIGARAASGTRAQDARAQSVTLRGNTAYQTLRARHPEYMEEVARRLKKNLRMVGSTRLRSYHVGQVAVAFGIAPDGSLLGPEPREARPQMLAEQQIVLEAVRASAPFPPFTEDMKRDAALFRDIGFGVEFR